MSGEGHLRFGLAITLTRELSSKITATCLTMASMRRLFFVSERHWIVQIAGNASIRKTLSYDTSCALRICHLSSFDIRFSHLADYILYIAINSDTSFSMKLFTNPSWSLIISVDIKSTERGFTKH